MPRSFEGAGPKRSRVEIQSATESIDSFGQVKRSWSTTRTAWAHVESTAGAFAYNAGQQKDNVTHRLTMRWFPGLNPSMRFLFGTRVLNIFFINNIDERNREYVVMCQEIVATT